jgi:hypothetical protein
MIQAIGFRDPKNVPMNNCSLNDQNNLSQDQPAIRVSINNLAIVMKVRLDANVHFGDILFPEWVFSALNLKSEIECSYRTICSSEITIEKDVKIELCFISYRRLRQWDEGVSDLSTFEQPLFWSNKWPDSVDVCVFETMCPMLLCGDYIGNSSVIAIKVMDLTMVRLDLLQFILCLIGTCCVTVILGKFPDEW